MGIHDCVCACISSDTLVYVIYTCTCTCIVYPCLGLSCLSYCLVQIQVYLYLGSTQAAELAASSGGSVSREPA